jgi:hypothetical protein
MGAGAIMAASNAVATLAYLNRITLGRSDSKRRGIGEGDIRSERAWLEIVFEGSIKLPGGKLDPGITGTAFVSAESELVFEPQEPLPMGIRI